MDKTHKVHWPTVYEERFRTPSRFERNLGLWVDRIGGAERGSIRPEKLRILGQYAAIFVNSGTGSFISEATGRMSVNAGDAILQFPDEPAMYYPEENWSTIWIVWNGPEAMLLEKHGFLLRTQPILQDTYQAVSQAYMRLHADITREDKGAALERKSVILHMIHMLFNTQTMAVRTHWVLEKALSYLSKHYAENFSIHELANQLGLSPSHFRHVFKAHTGRNPREFITALRVSKAKELLAEGKRVGEAAHLVGYNDEFYFMRVFKKLTGISPGKFR